MNINGLEWKANNNYWDRATVGGYEFFRATKVHPRTYITGDYQVYLGDTSIYTDIDVLTAQAILYHILAGGKLDETGVPRF